MFTIYIRLTFRKPRQETYKNSQIILTLFVSCYSFSLLSGNNDPTYSVSGQSIGQFQKKIPHTIIMDPSSTNNRSHTDQSDKPNQHKTNLSEKSTIIIFILNQNKSEPLTIPITKHAVNINANNILFVLLEYIFTIYKAHTSKTSSGDIQKEPTNMADSIRFFLFVAIWSRNVPFRNFDVLQLVHDFLAITPVCPWTFCRMFLTMNLFIPCGHVLDN